jgi:hypothetical protein
LSLHDLDVVEAAFPVLMNYADVLDEFARPPPAGFSSRELTHEEEMLLEKLARQIPMLACQVAARIRVPLASALVRRSTH